MLEMLTAFYGMMGNPPEANGALALMARALAARAEPVAVNLALDRCMVECRFPVRLPDIFRRIPGIGDLEAEKRLAWDVVERFVSKWARWNSDRTSAFVEAGAPKLAPRILDSVRRSGGWTVYLRMTDADFPHIQKRFFEEFETWTDVERISDRARLLEMPAPVKQLAAAKSMDPTTGKNREKPGKTGIYQDPSAKPSRAQAIVSRAIANSKARRI